MVLKVYGDPMSQPCRAVHIFLLMTGIEHEYVPISLMHGEHRKPRFLAINPLAQVPAIQEDSGFTLGESHAILPYLATSRRVADHWYPSGPQKRAVVDRYLHWHHSNLRRGAYYVFAKVYAPLIRMKIPEAVTSEALMTRDKALAQVEAWLTVTPFLAGTEVSIADLTALCELTQQSLVALDFSQYPKIQAWMRKLMEIPAVQQAHEGFNAFKEMVTSARQSQEQENPKEKL